MKLKGIGVTSIPSVYGYMRQASEVSQNYYPERLGKLYPVNAPWGFSSVFSVIKVFLDYRSARIFEQVRELISSIQAGVCSCRQP
ncbi:hypothetical protein N7509_012754 [Penicillium cosmopolitanum]|uniref:CRAL-TRIO domain-containing protein n=1 Tax=Penicillium cosmopolitanum TaxID=1131564 RepID=A0A9W9SKJ9_9EURO|nr:uncharacterized protein N7509_012754 [Penicillium cosmopolitanum]KAJ5379635.1 hypothetical protein N7509_012754 [Penicillium cosmopolitanum]